jgi:hypothetical protein
MRRFTHFLAATITAFTITTHPCAAQSDAPAAEEVKAVAEQAYIHGLLHGTLQIYSPELPSPAIGGTN